MKVKRLKRAARVLTFFRYNFGYHPPHSILLDGTFCQAALQNKINLREQMPKYLAEPPERVQMYVTECILHELKELGALLYGALVIAEQFRIAKCPHKPLRTAAECMGHLARRSKRKDANHTKYFVATQDDALLEKLRALGGIPIMSIRHNTIILEKPSDQSQKEAEQSKPTDELDRVKQMRRAELGEEEKRHRKRRAKGPNPLSCRKKKKVKQAGDDDDSAKVKGAFGRAEKKDMERGEREGAQDVEAGSEEVGGESRRHPPMMSAAEKAKKRRIRKRLIASGRVEKLLVATATTTTANREKPHRT